MPLPFARSASVARPTFSRDFAGLKTLDHGVGPAIKFERGSNATYFNAAGVLTTATTNEPRFDHSGGTSLGLLIEEARTNSIPNSQMSGAVAGSAGTAPTGWSISGNANNLTRTISTGSVNGFNYIDVAFVSGAGGVTGGPVNITLDPQTTTAGYAASNGQTWCGSVYLALVNGSIPAGATVDVIVRGRKTDNTGSNDQSTSGNQLSLTSSLARYSTARTFSSADTTKVTLDIRVTTVPDAATVNFTLRIAAPQLEQGAFPTSYIPTTTAAATRAADSAVVTPISSFYNQAEGTFVAEASYTGKAPAVFSRIFSIGNTTAGDPDRWFWGFNDANTNHLVQHFTAGVFDYGVSFSTSANTVYKVASAIALNNARSAQNGSLLSLDDTSVGTPSNKTHMVIGGSPTGVSGSAIYFRKIAYWPKRLSNTLLQQITT